MSGSKREHQTRVRADSSAKSPALRRNDHDASAAYNPASLPALPPLKCLSPAFMAKPLPAPDQPWLSQPADLSVAELPQLVAKVGPEMAVGESVWMEGPGLMASAMGTDIPFRVLNHPQDVMSNPADHSTSTETWAELDGAEARKERRSKFRPLTGTEVFEIFAKKRHLGELQFYHLKARDGGSFRPYELYVVPRHRAGSDHYIFSPTSVIHIQDGQSVDILTLAGWYQEAVLWKALREIPFFRLYLLRKNFTHWHGNVREIVFRRRRALLHAHLLTAVPQITHALLHVTRLLEELKSVPWLPHDESGTYTLLEFQTRLSKTLQESRGFLERFLHFRSLILTMVRDFSYSAYQAVQREVEVSQQGGRGQTLHILQGRRGQPLHVQQAGMVRLRGELKKASSVLHKLGRFAALVDHIITQGLVTISRREVTAFHTSLLKRDQEAADSLFQTELMFSADGQLIVFPPLHLFQDALSGTLCSVHDTVLQAVDSCHHSDLKESAGFSHISGFHNFTCSTSLGCKTSVLSRVPEGEAVLTGGHGSHSAKKPCAVSTPKLLLSSGTSLQVQGQRLRMQYCALSRPRLEWHLKLHAGTQEIEKDQTRITEEAFREIRQLCEKYSWLVDTYLFTSQWKPASLASMQGLPALKYEEYMQKVQSWIERVRSVPTTFTTSNKLLTVNCSHIHEKLEPLLNTIEQDILKLLSEELRVRSGNLISELKKVVESLKSEPTDLSGLTNYVRLVKCYKEMSADMQPQIEYICSLQKIAQLTCSTATAGEETLVQETLDLWKRFVPLLERAAETVSKQLPSVADTLDCTFSSLSQELCELVSKGMAAPLHLGHSAGLMNASLRGTCRQLDVIAARLHDLSRTSVSLRGRPLDLTFVTTAKQTVEAQKGLWELLSVSSTQIQEWKLLLFSKFVVSKAQEKVNKWLEQAASLAKIIPSHNAVLQETLHVLESFSQQLSMLAELSNPAVKLKHWRSIFKSMGLPNVPDQNVTVADLMTKGLWEHRNKITKWCREARAEASMQQQFRRLQRSWAGATFRLTKFIFSVWQEDRSQQGGSPRRKQATDSNPSHNAPLQHSCDSGTFTIIGLGALRSQTEDSVMTLSRMLFSPHAAEFRREAEHWLYLLQELEELLDVCERYQKKWIFLSKLFNETFVSTQKVELLEKFSPVDKTFREIIQVTLSDPHVMKFVSGHKARETDCRFHGPNLHLLFMEGLKAMEDISSDLLCLLDSPRGEFPRLSFLSDAEVMNLLSLYLPPSSVLPLVRKCFRGVRRLDVNNSGEHDLADLPSKLDVSSTQMRIRGIYGALEEHVPFTCPLESHISPVVWLGHLEKKLHQTVKQLILKCIVALHCPEPVEHDLEQDKQTGGVAALHLGCNKKTTEGKDQRQSPTLDVLHLISEYPLQCILVAEEVLWCSEIQKVIVNHAETKWVQIKAQNAAKLQILCQAIQDTLANSYDTSLTSRRTVTALRAIILLTMKHSHQLTVLAEVKGILESAFEWQKLMKYRHSVIDKSVQSALPLCLEDPSCMQHSVYVDVLGTTLTYGYEYIGPENWMMVNTPSTDRAFLGMLLALNSYRCVFISGPLMSAKEKTVLQLGWALGQQVITLGCCTNTSPLLICQMLLGALQTGAWLVLDSVDAMEQGTLSVLGQYLADIHECLSALQGDVLQKSPELHGPIEKSLPQSFVRDSTYSVKQSKKMLFAGKNIEAKLSYGSIIISSNGYSAEIPDNLRVAARAVSLLQPDYTIITEVLLVSFGFSQAASISRRLISLFSLAKDSLCLPEFVSGEKSSWLVLLQKIIDASGTYFYRSSNEADHRFLTQKPVGTTITASDKILQEMKDHCSSLDKFTSNVSVVNSVREEQAVIRGIMLILFPAIFEYNRASQFRTIFEEIFPIARSFPVLQTFTEESEQNVLRDAITEELQQTGLCADTQMLHNTASLHQALQISNAVVLLGPPGSGKTTLYQTLAGALRQLAAKSAEAESEGGFTDPRLSNTSHWRSTVTVVLFPNALSHEELFGGCYEPTGSWWDGAFTKVLRDTEQHDCSFSAQPNMEKNGEMRRVKWLVLDGEPLTQSRWFDCLGTLGDPENPFLCLSSGEKVQPSQEVLKLLVESTSLADANPSTLTRCSLVYVSGRDLWKTVWKAEMGCLYREHSLDQSTLKMWSCLAEDLFSSTLNFLRHKELNIVMSAGGHGGSRSSPRITDGLQEIMSFIKILHALLEESGKGRILKSASKHTTKRDAGLRSPSTELQARNHFVVAYIWGFGGHLDPRHWPQFDLIAREALFESRYKIEVPAKGMVFEHFFNCADAALEDSSVFGVSRNKSPKHSYTCVPQYAKYAYLLDLMLEAHQSVLVVGEVGSGKTKLGKCLFSHERPHVHLPVSPLLSAADLRSLLESMGYQKTRLDSLGAIMQNPGLLLFLDDLHEAPFDIHGKTSMTLETLRESISRGGVLTSDDCHFKTFTSGAISYLCTCSTPGSNGSTSSQISPRLSRLFTVLALPHMNVDILFSLHSTQLQQWLKNLPSMPRITHLAHCIVTATFDVYLAVRKNFPFSAHTSQFIFSLHDLRKVFQGMCLWDPKSIARQLQQQKLSLAPLTSSALPVFAQSSLGPVANVLSIVRLWMHECLRTFGDRMCSDKECQELVSVLTQVSEENFGSCLITEGQMRADLSSPMCLLKGKTMEHVSRTPVPQDMEEAKESMTSRKESVESPVSEITEIHSKQAETLEWSSEEQNSSDYSLSSSETEEDYCSSASSNRSKKSYCDTAESASSTANCSPQNTHPSPPKETRPETSCSEVSQNMSTQQVQKQPDVSTSEPPRDSSRTLLQLLTDMGSSIHNVVFSPEVGEPGRKVSEHQLRRHSAYLERDMAVLVPQLAQTVASREDGHGGTFAAFAVHRQRLRQLTHVLRALLISGGHGALFGAAKRTGRKSTVRLAAYLTGHRLIEVHGGNEGKLKEMWKEAVRQIGIHGGHVVFLIHEDTSQEIREELLVVMATGTFSGHYKDEKMKVLNSSTPVNNPLCRLKDDQVLEKYFTNVQRNMHVILLLPLNHDTSNQPTGQSLPVAHISKAVSICCCVEVYQPWTPETLLETGSRLLQTPHTDSTVDKTLVDSIALVMAGIHTSATTYASIFLNIQPFSPQTYIELIAYFHHLCVHLCEEGRGNTHRMETVLTRVKEMMETAQIYSENVHRLETQYDHTQKSLKQIHRSLSAEHRHCERTRQCCILEENRLSQLQEQLEQAEQQAEDALKEVSPLYQAALKTIQSLNQLDLDEVRHYRHPPEGVVILMDTICMLFNRPCNWESCKQLLGQPNFLQELEFFDRSKLSSEILQKLGEIVQAPNFQPCAVRGVSRACESLCCWVRAVFQYAHVQRLLAPQDALKRHLVGHMAESRAHLREGRLQEEVARERLEQLRTQQQLVQAHLEQLGAQLHKAKAREREVTAALQQVSFFTDKWSTALQETRMNHQTVSGDALLLAAVMAYLGPFGPDVRVELLQKWQALCLTGRINVHPEDPRTSLFKEVQSSADSPFEPVPVCQELHRALARTVGMEHGAVRGLPPQLVLRLLLIGHSAPWAHHWALLAHTQQQEELGSQTLLQTGLFPGDDARSHNEDDYELVLPADDPELLDKLRDGAKKGLRVLLTHVERAVPTEHFLSMLARPTGSHFLEPVDPVTVPHPAFRLFLSTPMPVHALQDEIHPLILVKVKVIDLSLSTSQVQDVILSDLLQSECLELWMQHFQATRDVHILQDKLHQEEASLMRYILQSATPLLQDRGFLPHVSVCQSSSLALQAQLDGVGCELERHAPMLRRFQGLAALVTALYRALQESQRLAHCSHVRLRDFLNTVQQAVTLKGRPNVPYGAEALTEEVSAEISYRMVSHVLAQYKPCLFQSHAELLRLLVSVSCFLLNEGCTEPESIMFLKGFSGLEFPHCASREQNSPELPNWISPHAHMDVRLLERVSPFQGLVSSLRDSSGQWREYLHFPSSTVIGPVPCQSHSHLTTFQRAILWKTLFPEWLAGVADDLAACQDGHPVCCSPASSPHIASPDALASFLARNKGPVIVKLTGGVTGGSENPVHWIKRVAQHQAHKKQVKVIVISFGSECQRDVVLSALDTAVQAGHWLVLNNCHLLHHWDAEVISQLKRVMLCTVRGPAVEKGFMNDGAAAQTHTHPHFRLWFITKGNNPLSVPAVVRIHAVYLACESQWDLRNELCCSLREVLATAPPAVSPGALEPLLRCAVLHSVLLQRQKLSNLGQGSWYNWTREDLLALAHVQVQTARHCTDPMEVLQYTAAHLTYGGHVSDPADLEVVKAVCRVSLRPLSSMCGSGPHTLAEIINRTACSGESSDVEALLRALERCVQTTLNTTEFQALGFSEEMSREMVTERSHTLSSLLLQSCGGGAVGPRHGDGQRRAEELPDYRSTLVRLQALREEMGGKAENRDTGLSRAPLGPLHTFFHAEWNRLRETVTLVLDGVSQPSRDHSALLHVLTSTISELETQADLLREYQLEYPNSSPPVYCLSAFANPRGFLASLIRETVQSKRRDPSHVYLHFQVLGPAASTSCVPPTGVCLGGLELHGALWDTRGEAVHDTVSPEPCPLPLLWVRALVRNPDARLSSSTPLYDCPLYVHSPSRGGSLSEENIVTHVPLESRLDPALCTLRRVRLVSTLKSHGSVR